MIKLFLNFVYFLCIVVFGRNITDLLLLLRFCPAKAQVVADFARFGSLAIETNLWVSPHFLMELGAWFIVNHLFRIWVKPKIFLAFEYFLNIMIQSFAVW